MDNAFGDKNEDEIFYTKLTLPAHRLTKNWNMCGKVADYLSSYASHQFLELERAENIISMVLNELLEGLVVLCPDDSRLFITLQEKGKALQIHLKHRVHQNMVEAYFSFFEEIKNSEDQEKYYVKLLTAEKSLESDFNQLGLNMIICNFGAKFMMPKLDKETNYIHTKLEIKSEEFAE